MSFIILVTDNMIIGNFNTTYVINFRFCLLFFNVFEIVRMLVLLGRWPPKK